MSIKTSALMSKIPTGSGALFFIQIFSTLSYGVLYSTLVLFATDTLHFSVHHANTLIATFVAFNFTLHLVGGFLGGRVLSFRHLFLLGMLLQTIGSLLIAQMNIHLLYIGMAIFLTGAGTNAPCMNCMLTQLFEPSDKRRETAFLWNYSGMNFGFFIGISMAGYFQLTNNFSVLFLLSSIANVIAALIVMMNWKKLQDIKTYLTDHTVSYFIRGCIGVGIMFALIIILYFVLLNATFSARLIMVLGVIVLIIISLLAMSRDKKEERHKLFAFNIFCFASIIFFTLYQLCPMALTLFLQRNVDRHLSGFQIPTQWFLDIDSIVVIFGCPLFAYFLHRLRRKQYKISTPLLFSIGLVSIGIAIALLSVGIHFANAQGYTAMQWVFVCYVLLAVGEIFLSPIGYALVGELAPPRLRGILMGMWLMLTGASATLSNLFSNIAAGAKNAISPLVSNASYSSTFLLLGMVSIAVGILLFLIKPWLIKLMHEKVH